MNAMFAMAYGRCLRCDEPFSFNPHKVPSIRIEGQREPICQSCFHALNQVRKQKGLTPWTIDPGAYKATPEDEL